MASELPVQHVQTDNRIADVSLIICSRNRRQMLRESVKSVLAGEMIPAELIIIDQSDEPDPVLTEMGEQDASPLRYLWSQTKGLSKANNLGIRSAQHELLVFTHDDVFVESNWLGEIVAALQTHGKQSVVTGQVLPTEILEVNGFVPSTIVDDKPAVFAGRIGRDVLYPLNMAMYRTVVDDVGWFDERLGPGTPFPGAEDNDFCFRLLEAGYQIFYVPQAIVKHRAWRKAEDYIPLLWGYGRAQGAFFAKYSSFRDRHMLQRMIASIRKHAIQGLNQLFQERSKAYAEAVYVCGILSGATQWQLMYRRKRP